MNTNTILKEEYLTYFDPTNNSNKYYEAKVVKTTDGFDFITNWGRIGAKGASKIENYVSEISAKTALDKKVMSKIKKGYTRKDIVVNKSGEANVLKLDINNSNSKLDAKIVRFINEIYAATKNSVSYHLGVKSDISTPIGNLGINGINRGREILQKIADATNETDVSIYSREYFKTIPRKMSSRISNDEWILNTDEKINKELEILDLYEDALNVLTKDINSVDARYERMNCDIENVTDDEMEYIKNKIKTSHASNHHYTLNVLNAFKIKQLNAPDFDESVGNNIHLFHGTRTENLLGILSTNLKLPNTLIGVVKIGAMFGPGLYFANKCTKSANYSFGYWSGGNSNRAYILICEVALGKVYEANYSHYFTKAPNGYNSVKGCKGACLYNNEFIVYNENQVRIKYIVEVERHQ